MEDWQKAMFAMLEETAVGVEQFFQNFTEVFESTIAELNESIDIFTEEMQDTFSEIDRSFQNFFDPIVDFQDLEARRLEDTNDIDFIYVERLQPTKENHSACMGCANYHGQIYGDNLLVCGMHPYGWDGDNCPDWEEDRDNIDWYDKSVH